MSYRIDPGSALDAETRRAAAEQIDKAIAELSRPGTEGEIHEAIHDARKRFKKLRALLRLVRPGNERFYRAENARLRDVARNLSAVRDRTALIESLDALVPHVPNTLAAKSVDPAIAAVRAGLEARRRAAVEAEGDLSEKVAATLAVLGEARAALDALVFASPVKGAAKVASTGYALTYSRARAALERAERSGTAEDRHALRRDVKYLGFHVTLLGSLWPEAFVPIRAAAAGIADDLGRDHDYALLVAELAVEGEGALAPAAHCALVSALVESRQAELQAMALGGARRLLVDRPKPASARIRRLYRIAADEAAKARAAPAGETLSVAAE